MCARCASSGARPSDLVFGFQSHRVDHADVVGFRGGVIVVPIFDEIAGTVKSGIVWLRKVIALREERFHWKLLKPGRVREHNRILDTPTVQTTAFETDLKYLTAYKTLPFCSVVFIFISFF